MFLRIARVALDVPLHRLSITSSSCRRRHRLPQRALRRARKSSASSSICRGERSSARPVEAVLRDLPAALPADWFRLTEFCADYYQAPLGEVMLSTLPAGCAASTRPRRSRSAACRKSRRSASRPN
jgi:primosomal protein N' (replication factor Y)